MQISTPEVISYVFDIGTINTLQG